MKLILCTNTYYQNGNPLFITYTNKLKQYYCNKHDILFYHNQNCYYPGFHPVWFKLPMIRECLNLCQNENDWVIWMDADATTPNMNINIKQYLEKEEKKIIILKDCNNFNAGVFAVPNTARAKQFIDFIDSQRTNENYRDKGWREQQAMIDCFNYGNYKDFYKIPPYDLGFNAYPVFYNPKNNPAFEENKSWCLHMPGRSDSCRNKEFKKCYDKIFEDKININNMKIIVPQNELKYFNSNHYISYENKNSNQHYYNQQYYNKIEELLNINISNLNDIQFIGYCHIEKELIPIQFNINSFDIILGANYKVKNILNHFIVEDLYHRSNIKDYDLYISEFIKIFNKEQMEILLTSQNIHFGGQFIMPKQKFQDYRKYLINKLDLFTKSKLVSNIIQNRKGLLYSFSQRILELYVQKNKLKVFVQ